MVVIRKGRYAHYKGKEYRVYPHQYGGYSLVSCDEADLELGFIEEDPSTYTKHVNEGELDGLHKIASYAEYNGEKFDVSIHIQDGKVNLGTSNAAIAESLNFQRTDKYFYEKWVSLDEVRLIEEIEKDT
ncbi:hypothetical protein [Cohnella sp. GCM10027633]|uniref:hypothetical protein n=1 Tax=unclassified Cohnella TaxID=2636738 RepID=UPI003633017E